jgi:hypothetical protein
MEKYPVSEEMSKKTDKNGRLSGLKCQSIFLIFLSIYSTILIRSNLLCIATNSL